MTRKHNTLTNNAAKHENEMPNDNLFLSKPVVEFFEEIDNTCRKGLESVFCEFQDFSDPVVRTPDMQEFIEQMPTVFGRTWHHLCQLRGVKDKQQSEQKKEHSEEDIGLSASIVYGPPIPPTPIIALGIY